MFTVPSVAVPALTLYAVPSLITVNLKLSVPVSFCPLPVAEQAVNASASSTAKKPHTMVLFVFVLKTPFVGI